VESAKAKVARQEKIVSQEETTAKTKSVYNAINVN
jgi:hypothetical protein